MLTHKLISYFYSFPTLLLISHHFWIYFSSTWLVCISSFKIISPGDGGAILPLCSCIQCVQENYDSNLILTALSVLYHHTGFLRCHQLKFKRPISVPGIPENAGYPLVLGNFLVMLLKNCIAFYCIYFLLLGTRLRKCWKFYSSLPCLLTLFLYSSLSMSLCEGISVC